MITRTLLTVGTGIAVNATAVKEEIRMNSHGSYKKNKQIALIMRLIVTDCGI
jgi:hypothetical protein